MARSFWILDDITPLHQINEEVSKSAYLFESKDGYRRTGFTTYYNLTEAPEVAIELEFLESNGKVIQTFSSSDDDGPSAKRGMNRFAWNLRYPAADVMDDASLVRRAQCGPLGSPWQLPGKAHRWRIDRDAFL